MTQSFDLGRERSIELLAEAAHFANAGGSADDITYVTLGAAYLHRGWNVSLAGARRDIDVAAGPDIDDRLFQVSTGYAFDSGFGIDVGWRYGEEDDEDSGTLGVLATYSIAF